MVGAGVAAPLFSHIHIITSVTLNILSLKALILIRIRYQTRSRICIRHYVDSDHRDLAIADPRSSGTKLAKSDGRTFLFCTGTVYRVYFIYRPLSEK